MLRWNADCWTEIVNHLIFSYFCNNVLFHLWYLLLVPRFNVKSNSTHMITSLSHKIHDLDISSFFSGKKKAFEALDLSNINFAYKLYAVKVWLTFCNVGKIWVELWHQDGIEHGYADFPHAWRLLHTWHICIPDLLRSVVVHYGKIHPLLSHWDIRLRPLHNLKCKNELARKIK